MAKPEWGLKRTCRECGKRFYDFRRSPIVCPGCQAVFDPLAMLRPRRGRASAAAAPPAMAAEAVSEQESPETGNDEEETAQVDVVDADIDDDAVIDTDDDDGMIKGTSDLDDDGIPGVIAEDGE